MFFIFGYQMEEEIKMNPITIIQNIQDFPMKAALIMIMLMITSFLSLILFTTILWIKRNGWRKLKW